MDTYRGYKYALGVIDVYSRYAKVVPLKDKKEDTVIKAFQTIYRDPHLKYPESLRTDLGSEFTSKKVLAFLNQHNVTVKHVAKESHAHIIERFFQTIQHKVYQARDIRCVKDWVSIIGPMTDEYNTTYHSTLKATPLTILTTNAKPAERSLPPKTKPKFKIGDLVRVRKSKDKYTRGVDFTFSDDVYEVTMMVNGHPTYYRLNNDWDYIYYEPELVLANQQDNAIDRVKWKKTFGK